LVLVSHSRKVAEGLQEMVFQIAGDRVSVATAGGTDDGRLGTSAFAIADAIRKVDGKEGVLVLLDLGSAALSTELALEELTQDQRARVSVSNAPFVEGAILAAVEASLGSSLQDVAAAAARATQMPKMAER
jgi:dihydroxyacetone kinase phosphotransfer subunit